MKTIYQFTAVILISLLSLSVGDGFGQNIGEMAPDFTLQTTDDTTFKLSDHKGKVVFVFLFGYNCPHCLANAPNTQNNIYEVYKSNPNFLAIGIDTWDGSTASVLGFKSRSGLTYTLCVQGSSVASAYQTTYDRMLVIDADGILRHKSSSNATASEVSITSAIIQTWLGQISGVFDNYSNIEDVIIYPNPARENINIEVLSNDNDKIEIQIINIIGREVLREIHQSNSQSRISLSVKHLPAGTYYLSIRKHGENVTSKFIIY